MDLNHIELPASVVAAFYRDTLIETYGATRTEKATNRPGQVEKMPPPVTEKTAPWKWLGENAKHVLVMVNNNEAAILPDKELNFLTGILDACKLKLADVVIINLNNHPGTTYKELTSYFKSRIVFLFAVEPAAFGLPMSFPHYQIQSFANNSFLYAPPLKDLENDRVEKSKLWVCLKRLFNL